MTFISVLGCSCEEGTVAGCFRAESEDHCVWFFSPLNSSSSSTSEPGFCDSPRGCAGARRFKRGVPRPRVEEYWDEHPVPARLDFGDFAGGMPLGEDRPVRRTGYGRRAVEAKPGFLFGPRPRILHCLGFSGLVAFCGRRTPPLLTSITPRQLPEEPIRSSGSTARSISPSNYSVLISAVSDRGLHAACVDSGAADPPSFHQEPSRWLNLEPLAKTKSSSCKVNPERRH